jgi:hypothetical protein
MRTNCDRYSRERKGLMDPRRARRLAPPFGTPPFFDRSVDMAVILSGALLTVAGFAYLAVAALMRRRLSDPAQLRVAGLVMMAVGVILVWSGVTLL